MPKILTDRQHYENIADAIRAKNGETTEYYPSEMSAAIDAIIIPDTLVVANGDIAAIRSTDKAYTPLTATANDIRLGTTAITEEGTIEGTKDIPNYLSRYGKKLVPSNTEAVINVPEYNYRNLMVTITTYNTTVDDSVASTYISVDNSMYAVGSSTKLSDISIDNANAQIKLGIIVNEKSVLRYFVVKEEI